MQTASKMTTLLLGVVCLVLAISMVSAGMLYSNFSKLQNDFNALQSQYNELSSQYENLQTNNSRLESQFSNLQSQYDSLQSNYSILQSSYNNLMNAQTAQAGVFLNRDAVSWPTNTAIKLYVRNTGTSDATIDAVYIGTSSSNLDIQTGLIYDPSNGAVAAYGGLVSVTIDYSWSTGTTYYFKVVPKVGPSLEFNVEAPSFDFTNTEQLTFTNNYWASNDANFTMTLKNTGSTALTLTDVRIDGTLAGTVQYKLSTSGTWLTYTVGTTLAQADKGVSYDFSVTRTGTFTSGIQYSFTVITAKGNTFGPFITTAP